MIIVFGKGQDGLFQAYLRKRFLFALICVHSRLNKVLKRPNQIQQGIFDFGWRQPFFSLLIR
jgi:hypothetical protein